MATGSKILPAAVLHPRPRRSSPAYVVSRRSSPGRIHGPDAWTRGGGVARTVLEGVARGFLSAGDERFHTVRGLDTLGRELWCFPPGR
ncbi:hypothetical protein [Kitasatospora sp. NPDC087314]|uniref:hypothetical protein n=1 Tax=Kitasatospora sp. NPDC087314 TaxID=3364068 RepID=UPI00380B4EEC